MIRLLLFLVCFQASAEMLQEIQKKQADLQKESDSFQKRAMDFRNGEICKGVKNISLNNLCKTKNIDSACWRQNACITNVLNAESQVAALKDQLHELKTREIEARNRPVEDFKELVGQKITLPHPRVLNLEGYDSEESMAFVKRPNDACLITVKPVENFPQTGGYALPDKALKWKVGPFQPREPIRSSKDCEHLPRFFRSDCRATTAGHGTYAGPNLAELKADDGKVMTVYTLKGLSGETLKCLRNSGFDIRLRDATIQNAPAAGAIK